MNAARPIGSPEMWVGVTVHRPENLATAPGNALWSWGFDGGTLWSGCEPVRGQYDMTGWRMLAADGRPIIAVIGSTPTWCATQVHPDVDVDPWGVLGGWSAPSDPEAAADYAGQVLDACEGKVVCVVVGNEIQGQYRQWADAYEAVYARHGQRVIVCAASVQLGDAATIRQRMQAFRAEFQRAPSAVDVHVYHWQCSVAGAQLLITDAMSVWAGSRVIVGEMGLAPYWEAKGQVMPWRRLGQVRQAKAVGDLCAWMQARGCMGWNWYDLDGYSAAQDGWIYPAGDKPLFLAGIGTAARGARNDEAERETTA